MRADYRVYPILVRQYQPPNAYKIISHTCDYFGITTFDIVKECRQREIVYPRQVAMWAIRGIYGSKLSLSRIGEILLNRYRGMQIQI